MKQMLKLIVTSATYRQSSAVTPELVRRDPYNRLLGPRAAKPAVGRATPRPGARRVGPAVLQDARAQRDAAAARRRVASRLQQRTMADPDGRRPLPPRAVHVLAAERSLSRDGGVRRPQPRVLRRAALADQHAAASAGHAQRPGVRRGGPSARHDAFWPKAARRPCERVAYAFRRCLSRQPKEAEVARLVALVPRASWRISARMRPRPKRWSATRIGPLATNLDPAEAAAWTVVANVLLNLDETVTKG